jgi:hypothetical protein
MLQQTNNIAMHARTHARTTYVWRLGTRGRRLKFEVASGLIAIEMNAHRLTNNLSQSNMSSLHASTQQSSTINANQRDAALHQ